MTHQKGQFKWSAEGQLHRFLHVIFIQKYSFGKNGYIMDLPWSLLFYQFTHVKFVFRRFRSKIPNFSINIIAPFSYNSTGPITFPIFPNNFILPLFIPCLTVRTIPKPLMRQYLIPGWKPAGQARFPMPICSLYGMKLMENTYLFLRKAAERLRNMRSMEIPLFANF